MIGMYSPLSPFKLKKNAATLSSHELYKAFFSPPGNIDATVSWCRIPGCFTS